MERKGEKDMASIPETELHPLKPTAPNSIEAHDEMKRRCICFNEPTPPDVKYPSNKICTSKYTFLTWAPKSLVLQFRRAANVYFLIISILTAQESFSPKNPISMIGTFAAILIFTMFKEAYEDYFRHKADNEVNLMKARVLNLQSNSFEEVHSQDIRVGDIVEVKENEQFPADLVYIASNNDQGLAFVNTMNLDGETNLKSKIASNYTKQFCNVAAICELKGQIWIEEPNQSLTSWTCNIIPPDGPKAALGTSQALLRGCILKNTDFIYGLVVYTGPETKIMLNSKAPPAKMSNVMRKMNKMLYTVFLFQAILVFLFAGLNVMWVNATGTDHEYLDVKEEMHFGDYIIQVLTFLVAYSHMIPISLYVALEIVKMILAYMIQQDLGMYYEEDDRPAACRTSDLVEELGQVEFVFSDKTGTLTCNIMEFKKCSINGTIYGSDESFHPTKG